MQSHHCVGALNVKAKARKEAALLTVVAVALYWRRTARVCITKAPKAEAWMIFVGADKKAQARAEAKAEADREADSLARARFAREERRRHEDEEIELLAKEERAARARFEADKQRAWHLELKAIHDRRLDDQARRQAALDARDAAKARHLKHLREDKARAQREFSEQFEGQLKAAERTQRQLRKARLAQIRQKEQMLERASRRKNIRTSVEVETKAAERERRREYQEHVFRSNAQLLQERIGSVEAKLAEQSEHCAAHQAQQRELNSRRAVERELLHEERQARVARIQRQQQHRRVEHLLRIERDNERARRVTQERRNVTEARRRANQVEALQRQRFETHLVDEMLAYGRKKYAKQVKLEASLRNEASASGGGSLPLAEASRRSLRSSSSVRGRGGARLASAGAARATEAGSKVRRATRRQVVEEQQYLYDDDEFGVYEDDGAGAGGGGLDRMPHIRPASALL
mmetsp:Transcript_10969/g.36032  ORF Transcript_10969/g.36032 Transcript_10969/m.36032 type:complete len:463 (+) Transcript_10969:112-1500(+)